MLFISMGQRRTIMSKPRLKAELENFHPIELNCSCGCGKTTSHKFAVILQAFVYFLESFYDSEIKIIITSGARCKRKHEAVSGDPKDTSYHMGATRLDESPGVAADCYFKVLRILDGQAEWSVIPKAEVATLARKFGLFKGIGYRSYPGSWRMIHLDIGGGKERNW